MKRTRRGTALVALAIGALVLIVLSLFLGPAGLTPAEVLAALTGGGEPTHADIVLEFRLPRALLAFVVGAALAGAGVVFQGLFRNPLADPFIVGVSGGAALGAVTAIVLGIQVAGWLGLGSVTLFAFAGALLAVWIVYRLARVGGRVPVTTLLLCGFAVGAFASAIVSIVMLLRHENLHEILVWLLGSLERPDALLRVKVALPFVAVALAVVGVFARDLNLMLLGEESAQQLGVEVERVKKILLAAGAVAAAVAVAMCGIIGFVGLIVPHIVRLIVGPDHRTLLPVTIFAGGAFLVAADIVAHAAYPPSGLPVGTVTALAGAPFFLLLLRRRGTRA
ncbi:MAG: FecCD family ABC transporter permease [Planctomycetota bacterium]|jgi:iron complex transport system permease protein